MKHTMNAVLAALALGVAGVAQAQPMECQMNPGQCYQPPQAVIGTPVNPINTPGVGVPYAVIQPPHESGWQAYQEYQRRYQEQWDRRDRRDRDGDGVRNNRDRYPDDPRYR